MYEHHVFAVDQKASRIAAPDFGFPLVSKSPSSNDNSVRKTDLVRGSPPTGLVTETAEVTRADRVDTTESNKRGETYPSQSRHVFWLSSVTLVLHTRRGSRENYSAMPNLSIGTRSLN
ncbi:hypothetical protein ACJ72_04398 [Emergomyces africanus]|uniref:Uncharacterized protein n=1 Tax=Emergomyces africanus TaxID=1955775 RepID=A0A1B7NWW0_9EURO|nr:hypothetical protein ACJ72_04398 [Emergomyces africanus]